MRITLKKRLLFSFLAIGAVPVILVGLVSYQRAKAALTAQAQNNLRAVQLTLATRVERQFERAQNELESFRGTMNALLQSAEDKLTATSAAAAGAIQRRMNTIRQDISGQQNQAVTVSGLSAFRAVVTSGQESSDSARFRSAVGDFMRGSPPTATT